MTDIRAQGITDIAVKIVFDGDGGKLDAADLDCAPMQPRRRSERYQMDIDIQLLWEFYLKHWSTLHCKDDRHKSTQKMSRLSLWRAGLDVSCSIKKALAIVPKLDAKVVNLGKLHQVLGFASGKTIANFIQFIDNGMYTLSLKEGKGAANLDSDDDNEVIRQVVGIDDMEKVNGDVQEVTKHSLAS